MKLPSAEDMLGIWAHAAALPTMIYTARLPPQSLTRTMQTKNRKYPPSYREVQCTIRRWSTYQLTSQEIPHMPCIWLEYQLQDVSTLLYSLTLPWSIDFCWYLMRFTVMS